MYSNIASGGMVVTPNHLATQSAIAILKEGGTAVEAMVAAAATIAVVCPHANSIGGDGFWLIVPPNEDPIVIEACGAAGSLATVQYYSGFDKIPHQGPKSALTVAGTVGGWEEALKYVSEYGCQRMPVSKLLADAISYAENGFPITKIVDEILKCLKDSENYSKELFNLLFPHGKVPNIGELITQKELAKTLKLLAENGLNSYYNGELAELIAGDMALLGMPITGSDLANYLPIRKVPIRLLHSQGEIFNTPPPTQGLVSMAILGILDKLGIDGQHEGQLIHATVEATKQAFLLRNQITDPRYMKVNPMSLISDETLSKMAKNINLEKTSCDVQGKGPADTVWMGAMDSKGFSVSFIQSIYHFFGSGVLLPKTGIIWHNRGMSFSLNNDHILSLKPGKKPFHTLNPAAARLRDGRLMIYGTKGGDGQPQTQAAVFHRHVIQGCGLQESLSAPRWIYGDKYGEEVYSLQLESRFDEETIKYLRDRGHDIEILTAFSAMVGQAGALVRHPNGALEGAFDIRSDGSAAGF